MLVEKLYGFRLAAVACVILSFGLSCARSHRVDLADIVMKHYPSNILILKSSISVWPSENDGVYYTDYDASKIYRYLLQINGAVSVFDFSEMNDGTHMAIVKLNNSVGIQIIRDLDGATLLFTKITGGVDGSAEANTLPPVP